MSDCEQMLEDFYSGLLRSGDACADVGVVITSCMARNVEWT